MVSVTHLRQSMYWLDSAPVQPLCRKLALHLIPKWTAASDLEVISPQPSSPNGEIEDELSLL